MSKPADTSSTTDPTISATTSVDRSRSVPRLAPRAPSFNADPSVERHVRNAGRTPNTRPVTSVSMAAPTSIRRSTGGTSAIGKVEGTSRAIRGAETTARRTPNIPPAPASSRLSVIICRTNRSTLAPTAARTANSVRRESARDINRLARLVHAISSTQSDAPTSPHNSMRDWARSSSRQRNALALLSASSLGYCCWS